MRRCRLRRRRPVEPAQRQPCLQSLLAENRTRSPTTRRGPAHFQRRVGRSQTASPSRWVVAPATWPAGFSRDGVHDLSPTPTPVEHSGSPAGRASTTGPDERMATPPRPVWCNPLFCGASLLGVNVAHRVLNPLMKLLQLLLRTVSGNHDLNLTTTLPPRDLNFAYGPLVAHSANKNETSLAL